MTQPDEDNRTEKKESPSESDGQAFNFESVLARKAFDSLVDSFIDDYMLKRYAADKSGWRTMSDIANRAKIPISSVYGRNSNFGQALDEPMRRGLIERRIFPGERGRGGEVVRLRIVYEKEPIREYVNSRIRHSEAKTSPLLSEDKKEIPNIDSSRPKERVRPDLPLSVRRVAVLPFANISPDPADEYFADGMTEELIFCISKITELNVISRTSVMQYKREKNKRATDVGRELGAGTLLEGSVRKATNRVRVSVQLIDVAGDVNLWAREFDREISDVFSIQSEIAEKVASSLKIRLLSADRNRISKAATMNVEAHTLFLKGCYQLNRHSKESYLKAIQLLEQAIAKDTQYALAYSKLAYAYVFLGFQGLSAQEYAFSKSETFARKALELDEMLPEAHMSLGFVMLYKWNIPGAELELKRAIEIEPNLAAAHVYYANLLYFSRRFEESLVQTRQALELDPISAEISNWAGTAYLYAGRLDEAIEQFQNALEIDPSILMARNNLGVAFVQKKQFEAGINELQKALELGGEGAFPQVANDLAYAYCALGRLDEARFILQKMLELRESNPSSTQFAIPIAGIYTSLGEIDKAIEWLERAYEQRSPYLVAINPDLVFDRLRDNQRFQSLLKKIGLS